MQALVIGDLHFEDKPRGLMKAQAAAVKQICVDRCGDSNQLIFLGDLMMHRNPRPTVLLALKELLDDIVNMGYEIHILRGNHDSVTKADDGVTALSLFESKNIHVYTQYHEDHKNEWVFIPHYEDEQRIKEYLASAPKGYTVFGHFGYYGVLNSAGDADFNLSISDFKNPTILGHIHKAGRNGNVSVLGTPYTTNFGEEGKDCFYGIVSKGNVEKIPSTRGPRHLVIDYDKVEENLDWLNSGDFNLIRVNIGTLDEGMNKIAETIQSIDAPFVEVKYKPLLDDKEVFVPDDREVTSVMSDDLIDHYINSSNTKINKEDLLEGLKQIHENQQSRNH
jgi:calcineurin-like phosphoesterase family protein